MSILSASGLKTALTPPSYLLPWLECQDSMTLKLKEQAGDARLTVLGQQWTRPGWWESYVLKVSEESVVLREILMAAHDTPCWYARTVIPASTYHTHAKLFSRLKSEPLGQIIFNEPCITRKFQINYAIDSHCLEYHWMDINLTKKTDHVWARLAVFVIDTDPFYLIEILLPDLVNFSALGA